MPSSLTIAEVARHNTEGDAYIVVDNKVYDVSKFAAVHPGGRKILLGVAGKDATRQFKQFHSSNCEYPLEGRTDCPDGLWVVWLTWVPCPPLRTTSQRP